MAGVRFEGGATHGLGMLLGGLTYLVEKYEEKFKIKNK